MRCVNLGRTGLKVSRFCLGCMTYGSPEWRPWVLDEEASRPFIRRALEAGVNFFDTADMYSKGASEIVVGRALKEFGERDRIVLATKVYNPMSDDPNDRGLSRKHILSSIDNSLRRLGTDHVDLYQIHRFDDQTPIEETLEALDAVVRAGKARYLGASSMYAWQLMEMLAFQERHRLARFVSMQNHYNLLYREEEREMLPLCRAEGLGVIPWSPLARGLLAGRGAAETTRSETDEMARQWYGKSPAEPRIIEAVRRIAAERSVSPAQIALAWVGTRPGVTAPIVGASKPHHLDDALESLEIELTSEEVAMLEAPYLAQPVAGHS